jgi:hypothetical protein
MARFRPSRSGNDPRVTLAGAGIGPDGGTHGRTAALHDDPVEADG